MSYYFIMNNSKVQCTVCNGWGVVKTQFKKCGCNNCMNCESQQIQNKPFETCKNCDGLGDFIVQSADKPNPDTSEKK